MTPPVATAGARRRLAARVAGGLVLALAILGSLEGVARLVRPAARQKSIRAEEQDWLAYSPLLGWHSRPGFRGFAFGADRAFDRDGFFAVDDRSSGADRRVMFLGDSRTFGNGVETGESFAEVVQQLAPRTRVWNLGTPGHSSYQGLAALQLYAPRLHPDVVVFAYGFNDRRYVVPPVEPDGASYFRRLARRELVSRWLRSLAFVDLLLGQSGGPVGRSVETKARRQLDLTTVAPRVSAASYGLNVEAAARYCAKHGIRLVLLLLSDNPEQTRDLENGVADLRTRDYVRAEGELRQAAALDNNFSDAARLYLAKLYGETGRAEAARRAAESPRTFLSLAGGYPIAADSEYRAIAERVATERGLVAVDAGAEIARHPDWYFDFCHFNRDGHRRVAELLLPAL